MTYSLSYECKMSNLSLTTNALQTKETGFTHIEVANWLNSYISEVVERVSDINERFVSKGGLPVICKDTRSYVKTLLGNRVQQEVVSIDV